MNPNSPEYGIDLSNHQLFIFDLNDPESRIAVDQVVFDATRIDGTVARGYVTAVHGLPQEVAHILPASLLRSLGAGAHISTPRVRPNTKRMRAVAGKSKFELASHP